MNKRCINNLTLEIFEDCFLLSEVSMFVLPNTYIYYGKHINNWKNILSKNLQKVYERHRISINITIETYSIELTKLKEENIELDVSKLLDFLISLLLKDIIVYIKINNYTYPYGYLIIPGEKIIKYT